jgi:hypothetical protein
MGELMALALVCTMSAAVLFQPALMGRPRERAVPKSGSQQHSHLSDFIKDAPEPWLRHKAIGSIRVPEGQRRAVAPAAR